MRGEAGGGGEERAGLHLDDAEILGLGEGEVEAALGLDDFALADLARGVADLAADVDAVEVGGQGEGVGEQGVAEQDGERVAPFGVGGGHHAAGVGAVDDVVVDERGHVDELEDDADFQVVVGDAAGGAADEDGEGGADALAGGVADVGDVGLDGGIEAADLLADGDFHALEFRADEFEGKKIAAGGGVVVAAMVSRTCP